MVIQPIPLRWFETPKGRGSCDLVILYGPEADMEWVCTIVSGPHINEIWTFSNPYVCACDNRTLGRVDMVKKDS